MVLIPKTHLCVIIMQTRYMISSTKSGPLTANVCKTNLFYSDLSSIICDRKLGNLCLYCICHCLHLVSLENWSPVPPVFMVIKFLFTHRKAAFIWETISDLRLKPKKLYSRRNVSPSLGLFDYFPGCGILNYRSDRDWSLRVCYFGGAL